MRKARLSEIQFKKVPMEDPAACRLYLGSRQQAVGVDHDNRARRRTIEGTPFKG